MPKPTLADTKETPLMKQYNTFKQKYPGTLILFRVGDFYETFGEDAIKASRILNITLTKRHNGAASEIELAGFPHHALNNYLPKLVRAGERVAICDQLEDPKYAKTVVKRGITEIVTPGIAYNDNVLEAQKNNYLCAIAQNKENWGISFLDVSTGEFLLTQGTQEYIEKLIQSFSPSEILFSKAKRREAEAWLKNTNAHVFYVEDWFLEYNFGKDLLTKHFKTISLKGFGIEHLPEGIAAAGAILHYLSENNHKDIRHITQIARIDEERYVWLDKFTIRNLELIYPQHENGVALLQVLDKTHTSMGARLLQKWVALPLKDKNRIEERQSVVETLYQNTELLDQIATLLRQTTDIERLISKVASQRINPREVQMLKKGLQQAFLLKQLLTQTNLPILLKFANQLADCQFVIQLIEKQLKEDVKTVSNEGNLIKDGNHAELDELRDIVLNSKKYLEKVRQHAAMETGITSLKIDYNKVFGYYLEVSNAHKHKVPKTWIRKQTLTNAERYITEELKVYEDKILNAEEKIIALEQKLFQELVNQLADFITPIQLNAKILAQIDCLTAFAKIALQYNYVKPILTEENKIVIEQGRHPVIERQLSHDEPYVPNDIFLDTENQQIIVITGPNMAGKSALLRQTALIVIMAQIGSFVPAQKAEIGITDKIFTRVGASDNIAKGESTFMVEMMETASIMNNLSERSLILMDEIGRGTSTYDGISIAWAILEYLHQHPKYRPKTLFATHYHELNELTKTFPRIKNFHVTVKEVGNKIIFLRKLAEGGAEHSFGIHVAQLAGMPQQIVLRANEIMQHLEQQREQQNSANTAEKRSYVDKNTLKTIPQAIPPMQIFEATNLQFEQIKSLLAKIDINTLSPIEALLKLNELKNLLK
ncbi:MAG: DNA mismatch repair protein MutS [Microscillaceae bacterium]|nr:DNA mismatch repair protein MutS [Microscillaceae bacterium]MDW8461031.1 DNA mismatch repair protein MutS [Cytophagales bacterium]